MVIPMDKSRVQWLETPIGMLEYDALMEGSRVKTYQPLLVKEAESFDTQPYDSSKYGEPDFKKRCYDTAYKTANMYGLTYCEGLIGIPYAGGMALIGHGWCIDDKGFVVDPTVGNKQHGYGVLYIGVPIKLPYVTELAKLCGFIGVLDGNLTNARTIYTEDPPVWRARAKTK